MRTAVVLAGHSVYRDVTITPGCHESPRDRTLLSESLTKLVEEFAKLPGIGKKSAERLAYDVLRSTNPRPWPGRRDSR